jgi:uncharacterized protein (TIGR02145 family)
MALSFTTFPPSVPILNTLSITSITDMSASGGGNIYSDGGEAVTMRGICWSKSANPTISDNHTVDGVGTGSFVSSLTELSPGTTYYVRAYATNKVGTGYGNEVSFSTLLSDIEGNIYETVIIGTQIWMAENLKTTKYNDGTNILLVTLNSESANPPTPAYYWYDNDIVTYKNDYGALYNWYSVNTGKLCPAGWHVPFLDEFNSLITSLGGMSVAGGKLKEAGTTHWESPNTGATNYTGFTALPGGFTHTVNDDWGFSNIRIRGEWWSSTENSAEFAERMFLDTWQNEAYIQSMVKIIGLSIRCLRD